MTDQQGIFVSSAVFAIGAYCLPASVLFGALVGASIFIMSRQELGIVRKIVLFVISLLCGIFAGTDLTMAINKMTPQNLEIGEFSGAALASALSVLIIESLARVVMKKSHSSGEGL